MWAIVRVASGNFLEMYDFMVFGYYAVAIGRAFFPNRDPFASLMLSLMTFGAGFLMRPLGAVALGAYADRVGRRKGLLLTLWLMSVGVATLAFTPPFRTIGVLAPLLVLFGRLIQGFSAGAELGGVSVYLSEIASPRHRGFTVSFQSASQQVAVMTAALIGAALARLISPAAMADWGWRLPLIFGCALAPAIFLIRRGLTETPAFAARPQPQGTAEVLRTLTRRWRTVGLGVGLVTLTTVSFYMITAYTPTFGGLLRLRQGDALLVTFCVGLSNLIWLPLMGALSDRVGRRPVLIAASALMALTAWPAMIWLAAAPTFFRLMAVELWMSWLYASYNGAMIVFLAELVPEDVRTTAFSLSYSLATALFGGFTAAVCTWLIHLSGSNAAPGLWLTAAALTGLGSVCLARPKTGRPGDGASPAQRLE